MTTSFEGEVVDIALKHWAGVNYGVLKLKLSDGVIIDLRINQTTKGPKPKLGVKIWVEVSDRDPQLIRSIKSPELEEPKEKKQKSILSQRKPVREEKSPSITPELMNRPLGMMFVAIYMTIIGIVFIRLTYSTMTFSWYEITFYAIGIVFVFISASIWRLRPWSRWIAIPLLILSIFYLVFLQTWGLIIAIMSIISIIYLLLPSTGTAIEAWGN